VKTKPRADVSVPQSTLNSSLGKATSKRLQKKTEETKIVKEPKKTKNLSVVPSSTLEGLGLSPVNRLKKQYGIDKNVLLTKDNVEQNRELIEKFASFFTAYPDIYLDLIAPAESRQKLFFYQRIFLRACMRFQYHYCIAARGYAKSYCAILAGILRCIFMPGTTMFVCAPMAQQGIEIAQDKMNAIFTAYPMLLKEVSKMNSSQQEINLFFTNGSNFDVLGVTSKSRGLRRNAGIIDEVRDQDPEKLNNIIIPVMNIPRRTASGFFNPYEPHQAQTWISSASQKSDYNYQKFTEFLERAVIDPSKVFVEGSDYRVPLASGLITKDYIDSLKNDPTYDASTFAREYLSIFTGGARDSWMRPAQLNRLRRIVNPHIRPRGVTPNNFYILSVDVARSGQAKTVICVFQVEKGSTAWTKKLVNIMTLTDEEMHFQKQANAIKRLIATFSPRQVVIDGTGLGRGLLDFMIQETVDSETGIVYPAYGSFNDEELRKSQPPNAPQIINVLILNASLASEIHAVAYAECTSGHVRLLIEENEAKVRLMATKKGQAMPLQQRMARLYPYEMTSRLIEEIGNLRVKATNASAHTIVLERINKEMQKDRFSAFEYGIYCAKQIEEAEVKKNRKKKSSILDFLMKN